MRCVRSFGNGATVWQQSVLGKKMWWYAQWVESKTNLEEKLNILFLNFLCEHLNRTQIWRVNHVHCEHSIWAIRRVFDIWLFSWYVFLVVAGSFFIGQSSKNNEEVSLIRKADLENHNKDGGFWTVIDGKVYDIKDFQAQSQSLAGNSILGKIIIIFYY